MLFRSSPNYDDDLTGSSFFETATVAGYPSQDYGGVGGLDFHSVASVDSCSIPGLMPASSGSTYGTAPSLFSTGSTDMGPPPPPGFADPSLKFHPHPHQINNNNSKSSNKVSSYTIYVTRNRSDQSYQCQRLLADQSLCTKLQTLRSSSVRTTVQNYVSASIIVV